MKKYIATSLAAILLLLVSSQVARADITSNLAGQWKFDEGSGSTAADSSGNGNALTFVNQASWGAAKIGSSAVTLNGSSQYAVLPASLFAGFPTSGGITTYALTFSTWFKTTSAGVILAQDNGSIPPAITGGYVPALYIDTAGKIRASMFWHGSTSYQIVTASAYNDGNWHQVVLTYGTGVETLYVDGVSAGTQTVNEVGYSGTYTYFLGTGYMNSWPAVPVTGWSYFNGSLDEARIYSRALSAADVTALYAYTGFSQGGGSSGNGSAITKLSGWAWSSNTGWISFNSTDPGTGNGGGTSLSPVEYYVQVSTTTGSTAATFSGDAWSSNLGWISFNPVDVTECPGGTAGAASAVVDSSGKFTGPVSGFVRVLSERGQSDGWDGCVRLGDPTDPNQKSPATDTFFDSPSNTTYFKGGVTYSSVGKIFGGFAWSNTVLGWLSFQNPFAQGNSVHPITDCNPNCSGSGPGFTVSATPSALTLVKGSSPATTYLHIARSGLDPTPQTITPVIQNISNPTDISVCIVNGNTCTNTAPACSVGVNTACSPDYTVQVTLNTANPQTLPYTFDVAGNRTVPSALTEKSTVTVTVTTSQSNGGPITLLIGTTPASIASKGTPHSLTIKKGNPFTLQWTINLDPTNQYTCSEGSTQGTWGNWNSTDLSGYITGTQQTGTYAFTAQDTSNANNPAGTYNFTISCSSTKQGVTLVSDKSTLILQSSSESEI